MVQSEEKVVAVFNRLYTIHSPNVKTVARSPFKTVVQITDAIDCYDMMLQRLQTLDISCKFEATYQMYSIDIALNAFRDQVRGDLHICKAV